MPVFILCSFSSTNVLYVGQQRIQQAAGRGSTPLLLFVHRVNQTSSPPVLSGWGAKSLEQQSRLSRQSARSLGQRSTTTTDWKGGSKTRQMCALTQKHYLYITKSLVQGAVFFFCLYDVLVVFLLPFHGGKTQGKIDALFLIDLTNTVKECT